MTEYKKDSQVQQGIMVRATDPITELITIEQTRLEFLNKQLDIPNTTVTENTLQLSEYKIAILKYLPTRGVINFNQCSNEVKHIVKIWCATCFSKAFEEVSTSIQEMRKK